MDIFYVGKATLNHIISVFKRDFCQKKDIIDDCVSSKTSNPLSAKQGKNLQDQITRLDESLNVATLDEVKSYINI